MKLDVWSPQKKNIGFFNKIACGERQQSVSAYGAVSYRFGV